MSSLPVHHEFNGTTMAPVSAAPQNDTTNSGRLRMAMATRSPGRTPNVDCSSRARLRDRRRTSANVSRSSSKTTLTSASWAAPMWNRSTIVRGARTKSRRGTPSSTTASTSNGAPGPMSGCSRGSSRYTGAMPRASGGAFVIGTQRAIWHSFHDALGAVHRIDPRSLADAYDGPSGAVAVLRYWRDALLDVAAAERAPRQLAMFEWLLDNIPASAEEPPAVCMGDARLVNAVIVGSEVRALVDFEVAYVGNPAADVGYSLFLDRSQRAHGGVPLPGVPSEEETWSRWSEVTGRGLLMSTTGPRSAPPSSW